MFSDSVVRRILTSPSELYANSLILLMTTDYDYLLCQLLGRIAKTVLIGLRLM